MPLSPGTRLGRYEVVRLLGAARYFHASDQAVAADWRSFAIRGIDVVEDAGSPEELATRLRGSFRRGGPRIRRQRGDHGRAALQSLRSDLRLVGLRLLARPGLLRFTRSFSRTLYAAATGKC